MAGNPNMAPIIIKKKSGGHGDGHGSSAWKIALADFMTALFIIFLVLWMLAQTTPEQKTGIADYFAPVSATANQSGNGQPLQGNTITTDGPARDSAGKIAPTIGGPSLPKEGEGNTQVPGFPGVSPQTIGQDQKPGTKYGTIQNTNPRVNDDPRIGQGGRSMADKAVEEKIRNALSTDPSLQNLQASVKVSSKPEGLVIDIVDSERNPLFSGGAAAPNAIGRALIETVARSIAGLPNQVSVSGHTDAAPLNRANYTNWELSSERANAARRILQGVGVGEQRIASVTGVADRDPYFKDDLRAAGNRRISITLLNNPSDVAAAPNPQAPVNLSGPAPEGRLIPR
ncbi:flagellar motor protein MotB [Lacibacterium aquatile]|uniref:Flagellar motor protein MotB n=1 Tax=Lacibacterium aquatile TaxID=1168082 RepID=A0ABW5DN80_9PROT